MPLSGIGKLANLIALMQLVGMRMLISWLCLLTLGLEVVVPVFGSVVCISDRGVRLEWSCEKSAEGECLADTAEHSESGGLHAEGQVDHHGQSAPCRDLPVRDENEQARQVVVQSKQIGHWELAIGTDLMAVLPPLELVAPARSARAAADAPARPPDVLRRLACIVMIV